ncbi:MAG: hypothetical protein IJT97_00985 [Bacteroidaceae bacterium]|nr:hypothetical protein [Bacteroidaceae bacterium]
MKNLNLLMGLSFAALSMTAQAQTTVVNLGFENGDTKYTTEGAYTPGGTFGDWINRNEEDVWNEQYTDDVHSGEFAFQMLNSDALAGNTWDRGFKVGNLQLKENTPYRVSFWVKADEGLNLKSTLSIGKEYFDMPISTASGEQYYNTFVTKNYTWTHYSYITYFTNKADQDALSGDYTGKVDVKGDTVSQKGDPFPNEYFITINMYNPGEYILDDIKLEEGVTFNEATFNGDVIKLNFGYPTNIADLAKASYGTLSLDPDLVSVTVDGVPAHVEFLEGQTDGFLYIFLDDTFIEEDQLVIVSFTPTEDCPIVYSGNKRPSADVESELRVFGFTGETAYFDETIDALPSSWSPAILVSTTPENNSFELEGSEVTNVSFTFDKKMNIDMTSATLAWSDNYGSYTKDLPDITLSEDELTINVALEGLADGENKITLSGLTNSYLVDCEDVTISLEVGKDEVGGTSEDIYVSDFDNEKTDCIPQGWLTKDATGIHQYGFMDEAQTIQYNYGWGHAADNPLGTQGGARLYQGFSGDFNKALYWCSRETNEGYASYGEIVKDYIDDEGNIAPDMPKGIALVLEPRKYQISFTMAAWKNEPVFRFTLEDLAGNVYAKFNDYVATPNMQGATGAVKGALKCVTDFTVPEKGYYVLKFAAQDAPWQEFLLANVKLITMPSKAAYYKQMLTEALEKAKPIYESAEGEEYDGATKTAFAAAIYSAENDHFTSPSAVEAMVEELDRLGEAMAKRVENIDNFTIALIETMEAYDALEGKYAESEYAAEAKTMIDTYENVNPSDLSDEELDEVTPKLVNTAPLLANIESVVNVLTWRAYKAFQTATTLKVTDNIKNDALNLATDDDAIIAACNEASKNALYKLIANNGIADSMFTTVNYDANQKIVVDGKYVDVVVAEEEEEEGEDEPAATVPVATSGIDFTCLIKNPKFYTYATDFGASLQDNTVVGWNCEQYQGGSVHLSGTAATAANPVVNSVINAYAGGAEYNFYQIIEDAPVGVYDVYLASRTAIKNNPDADGVYGVFNAMNDETGIWDKYIYAQVDDEAPIMVPFSAGPSWSGHPTVIKNVAVGEGQKLTIGVIEHLTSGKASDHDFDVETGEYVPSDWWNTNTFAGDARLYFVAPLEGYDYSAAGKISVEDITKLIDKYLQQEAGGNITVEDITNLIDKYLAQ